MANTTNFSVRMDSDIKKQCEAMYSELGINLTTAINVFLRQSLRVGGFPFDVRIEKPNKETIAVLTNMNQPLGRYVGNAMETKEAIDTLKGNGERDVIMVCGILGAYMLKLAGVGESIVENIKLIESKIQSGEGLEKFREMVGCQGGNVSIIDEPEKLMTAQYKVPVTIGESGYVEKIEAKNIGQAVVNLGGGRVRKEDEIDHAVGIEVLKKIGDEVKEGDTVLYIYANDEEKARSQVEFLKNTYKISKEKAKEKWISFLENYKK